MFRGLGEPLNPPPVVFSTNSLQIEYFKFQEVFHLRAGFQDALFRYGLGYMV